MRSSANENTSRRISALQAHEGLQRSALDHSKRPVNKVESFRYEPSEPEPLQWSTSHRRLHGCDQGTTLFSTFICCDMRFHNSHEGLMSVTNQINLYCLCSLLSRTCFKQTNSRKTSSGVCVHVKKKAAGHSLSHVHNKEEHLWNIQSRAGACGETLVCVSLMCE